ncbi:MAG TPA: flavodoxin [Clostridia bacterium]|nr:flavodoxin [Clostridia bacterium]
MQKILVVFYSHSKTTRSLAEEIALLTDGDLRELIPEKPYDFADHAASKQARGEIDRGHCPPLTSGLEPLDGYTHIFIGTPNWFKSCAPPVRTFLRNAGLAGKTLIPFCTHGGGGLGNIEACVAEACPHAALLPGFAATADFETQQVARWLADLGVTLSPGFLL